MTYVIVGLMIGLVIGIIGYNVYDSYFSKESREAFNTSQDKVMKGLKEKKDAFDKEMTQEQLIKKEELRQKMEELNKSYKDAQCNYNTKVNELEQDFQKRRENIQVIEQQQAAARGEAQQIEIQKERDRLNEELNKLSSDYKVKKESLDKDFFQFSEQISMKREKLSKEIQSYEERQKEIIARFKEEEEKKNKVDFYRIKLSDKEIEDVKKLKNIAHSFSKPEVLYKVIYEFYYKTKLEELFKRLLGENKEKGGIYKITNVNNNKTYIGKTTNFINRWRTHAKRGCGLETISGQLYEAMFNDGLENYTWEIVEFCSKDKQTEKEKEWINFYHSNEYGYNQKVG